MTALKALMVIFSLGILSCNNSRTETSTKAENITADTLSAATTSKSEQKTAIAIPDAIKRFVVDDYPVTNTMLADKTSNSSSYKKQSGQTYSYNKAWFTNDTLNQTIVFELYTDYHRMVTYHFYNYDIPADLINIMELHKNGEELATEKQKFKDFSGFLNQSMKINSLYFITDKGFRIGDTKQKAIETYGHPDKQLMTDGVEKLEWEFIGDEFYDSKSDLKGKPLAKDSFGHQIIMYFKKDKLIGLILQNDIP